MKTKKNLSIIAFILTYSGYAYALTTTDTLKVKTSAQCEHCKERIENKLKFTKGVKSTKLDIETKIVTIIYDSEKTNINTLRKAINQIGYDADGIVGDEKAYKKLPKCCKKSE